MREHGLNAKEIGGRFDFAETIFYDALFHQIVEQFAGDKWFLNAHDRRRAACGCSFAAHEKWTQCAHVQEIHQIKLLAGQR